MYEFKTVDFQSDLYYKVVDLRERVLRLPLGLKFQKKDLETDSNELIYSLIVAGNPVACVQARPLGCDTVKLRQMAVEQSWQGRGLGKKIISKVEELLRNKSYKQVELHARKTAIGFYLKMGYEIDSDEFTEVGIPHFRMIKKL